MLTEIFLDKASSMLKFEWLEHYQTSYKSSIAKNVF